MDLIIRYDPEVDILVIKIREGEIADEELLDNDILIGYDQQKRIVSIEIWEATKKGLLNALINLAKTNKELTKTILTK